MDKPKRTMTLNLTDREMDALEELSKQKDISKTAVLRQALRLYQLIDHRQQNGKRIFFEDPFERNGLSKKRTDLLVL